MSILKVKVWQHSIKWLKNRTPQQILNSYQALPEYDLNDYFVSYEDTVHDSEIEDAKDLNNYLNKLWRLLNSDDRPTGRIACSLSLGDLIQIGNKFYHPLMLGFAEANVINIPNEVDKFICPYCEEDLLDVGIYENVRLTYAWNEKSNKMQAKSYGSVDDRWVCAHCHEILPYGHLNELNIELLDWTDNKEEK